MDANNGKKYVLDSSILIKWLGEEAEDFEQAMQVRADYAAENIGVLIPALVFWELGNYLGRKYDDKTATSTFQSYQNYRFRPHLLSLATSNMAFKIMQKCPQASFYDASYHALAMQNQAVFLTSDKKYYDKTRKLGHIQLLKNYK